MLGLAQGKLAENNIKQAISIGEKLKDPKILGQCYLVRANRQKNRIEDLRKALAYFELADDVDGELEAAVALSDEYTSNGEYEEGFKYYDSCAQLVKHPSLTPWGREMALWYFVHIAELYSRAGDYPASLHFCRQGNLYAQQYRVAWNLEYTMIDKFTQSGQYDSALYYWKRLESRASPYVLSVREVWIGELGEIYLKQKKYDSALKIAKEGIDLCKKQKDTGFVLAGHLLLAAKAYTEMKNYKTALPYAKECLVLAKKNNMLAASMDVCQVLAKIYHQLGNSTNAYNYLAQYYTLKDSSQNKQFLLKMYSLKKQAEDQKKTSQIKLLNKENQLKDQKLKEQAIVRNSLVAGLVLVFLLAVFIFRNVSLKRKKEKAELQKNLTELEMQALRAQMNPHFIFNCLSSINRFIYKNDNKTASDYLTKFSRLIRMVLLHSQKRLVPLEDELEMLRLYLDMERFRFKNGFDYSITTTNTIDAGAIFIPPLLLQPFCENAIWHGLMNKEEHGHLSISISERDKTLYCTIADNGVGREKAAIFRSKSVEKEKSLGLKITSARLALLNGETNKGTSYEIEDILDERGNVAGTKVDLRIMYKENIVETEHA